MSNKPKLKDLDSSVSDRFLEIDNKIGLLSDKLEKGESLNVSLNRGTQIITVEQDTPVNVLNLLGKTTINHAPLFDSGFWNFSTGANIVSSSKLSVTANGTELITYSGKINVKSNEQYTISSLLSNPNLLCDVDLYDSSGTYLVSVGGTFLTPNNASYLLVRCIVPASLTTGDFTFENVMLNEGTETQSFVANVQGITNSTIENKTTGESITLLGTFHEGDEVNLNGTVTRKRKEIVLDGSLDWKFDADHNGFKIVRIENVFNKGLPLPDSLTVVKFNGKILLDWEPVAKGDMAWLNVEGTGMYLSIPDNDSFWGENYIPLADEIKACLYGWKMANTDVGWHEPFNGTGTKGWYYLESNGEPAGGTTVLPTTQAPINNRWQPYRSVHELVTPTDEPVRTVGSISFHAGDNQIEVTEGRIVRERANTYFVSTYNVYNINNYHPSSKLKHKVSKITNVYKNGEIDNTWNITNFGETHIDYGNQFASISISNFDPTAIYDVDYIPLESYKITAPTNPITVEYQDKLPSVVSQLVNKSTNTDARLNIVEKDMVRKDAPANWIKPVLLNGWINNDITSKPLAFYKDDLGIVHIEGVIKSGVVNSLIFVLPKGYRPSSNITLPMNYVGSSTIVAGSIDLIADGTVKANNPSGSGYIPIMLSFKAEL